MSEFKTRHFMRLQRALTLLDIVIEDLNSAELDHDLHRLILPLHEKVLLEHQRLMNKKYPPPPPKDYPDEDEDDILIPGVEY